MAIVGNLVINIIGKTASLDKKIIATSKKIKKVARQFRALKIFPKAAIAGARKMFQVVGRLGSRLVFTFKRIAKWGTAAFAAITAGVIKVGFEFEKTMSRVQALVGITSKLDDRFMRLTASAERMGETTIFSASQASQAMQFFALAGFKTSEIIEAMPATMKLAAAGQMEMAEATDVAIKIMKGMGIASSDLGRTVDILTSASTNSNTTLIQLGEAMAFAGPVARVLGQDLSEVTAILMRLADAGLQGEKGGTAYRNIMARLSGSTESATKALAALGIQTKDANGDLLHISTVVDQLNTKLAGMGKAEQAGELFKIFQMRGTPGIAALMGVGGGGLLAKQSTILNDIGAAARVAATQTNNLFGRWTIFKSKLAGIAISISKVIIPKITQAFGQLNEWLTENKGTIVAWGVSILNRVEEVAGAIFNFVKFAIKNWPKAWEFMKNVALGVFDGLIQAASVTGLAIGEVMWESIKKKLTPKLGFEVGGSFYGIGGDDEPVDVKGIMTRYADQMRNVDFDTRNAFRSGVGKEIVSGYENKRLENDREMIGFMRQMANQNKGNL